MSDFKSQIRAIARRERIRAQWVLLIRYWKEWGKFSG